MADSLLSMNAAALPPELASIDDLVQALQRVGYFSDRRLATAVFLALQLQRPLLLEGEPGVGKTALAKALSEVLARSLIRLQCYDGLEQREALYEWNYAAQLLHMRAAELMPGGARDIEAEVYQARYLIRRPLLQALQAPAPGAVLLVDEVDRADEPFEAFLLEILGDYQLTIPELGVVAAKEPPLTILTSNRTREVHDAVRRRCFYHWIDFPNAGREREILHMKVPEAAPELTRQVVAFVQSLRRMDLYKTPGIAESINWAQALAALDCVALDPARVDSTLGTLLKYQDDIARIQGSEAARLVEEIKGKSGGVAG